MVCIDKAEGLDARLTALVTGTPGADGALARALDGWVCRSTIKANIPLAVALELRRRGLAATGAPEALRLDVLAGLLALAQGQPGNVRHVALLAAALVSATARPWGRSTGTRDDLSRAAGDVLGRLVPYGTSWTDWVWTTPVHPPVAGSAPFSAFVDAGLSDTRRREVDDLAAEFAAQGIPPAQARTSAEANVSVRWHHEEIVAAHNETMREVIAFVRRGGGVHLSPELSPTDELLANVARDVACNADLAASRTPSEAELAPPPLPPAQAMARDWREHLGEEDLALFDKLPVGESRALAGAKALKALWGGTEDSARARYSDMANKANTAAGRAVMMSVPAGFSRGHYGRLE